MFLSRTPTCLKSLLPSSSLVRTSLSGTEAKCRSLPLMPAQTQVHIELSISVTTANINTEKASLNMISAEIISAREADLLAQHSSG